MAASYKDANIAREIITDRYKKPRNKKLEGYGKVSLNKDSCIDDIEVELKIKDGVIEDLNWDGIACAITSSSTDIICSILTGMKVEEAIKIIDEYLKMAKGKEPYDENVVGELLVLHNISDHVSRISCATLGPEGILNLIREKIAS